ncbi:MAG: tetratricopeptide repeat protein [Alistipes sp.]|nr:tetratricopeptide repeat protein [Alistipes sp.]
MAKQNVMPQEAAIGEAVSKTEAFFENNTKLVICTLAAIFVIAGGAYCYHKFVAQPRIEKAADMISEAQYRFEAANPDYELALNGDENGAGFLDVIGSYGSTPSGNLAKHYAGICYLHLGNLDDAAHYLSKYSPVSGLAGQIVNAQNLGLQGDIAVELGEYDKAVKLYAKAVKASDNSYTAPLYLRKQGIALKALGKHSEAKEAFMQILNRYPASPEARDAEKLAGAEE